MAWLLLIALTLSNPADALEFTPKSEAQVSKQASRWSLKQWMEQKSQFKWMDVWLAGQKKETASIYEVYIGADHNQYDRSTRTNLSGLTDDGEFDSTRGHGGIFIKFFGLYGDYERSKDEGRTQWEALALLRLLGTSDQGSSLNLFYGLHDLKFAGDQVQNQQAGGSMTLYLLDSWAIQGKYHQFFEAKSDLQNDIEGRRVEASTWLEYGAFRIFGTWYKEKIDQTNSIGTINTEREGIRAGVRVYLDFKK
ncbi:MAG: hypothetical protein K2Q26_15250 [Bdellovibrionales bacterium]|nr:hypothetical protein [Bdellovibrionales bacterium]